MQGQLTDAASKGGKTRAAAPVQGQPGTGSLALVSRAAWHRQPGAGESPERSESTASFPRLTFLSAFSRSGSLACSPFLTLRRSFPLSRSLSLSLPASPLRSSLSLSLSALALGLARSESRGPSLSSSLSRGLLSSLCFPSLLLLSFISELLLS